MPCDTKGRQAWMNRGHDSRIHEKTVEGFKQNNDETQFIQIYV